MDMHPMVCSFCGAPVPDGDGGFCLAFSETLDALQDGRGVPSMWSDTLCASEAAGEAEVCAVEAGEPDE